MPLRTLVRQPRIALISLVLLLILAGSLSACIQDGSQLSGTSADKPAVEQSDDEEGNDAEEWEDAESGSGNDWEEDEEDREEGGTWEESTPTPIVQPTATRAPMPVRTKRP